jgi:dihydrofolate reductase
LKISLIAAMSENRVIGNEGRLPWPHLPEDWANFFRVTDGCRMIMGRKSYDTPDRLSSPVGNFVVTRQADYALDEGFTRAGNLEQALAACRLDAEVFVIGGEEIFRQALPLADCIHLTVVHGTFEGDAYFPDFDLTHFKKVNERTILEDANHLYSFTFFVYEKR